MSSEKEITEPSTGKTDLKKLFSATDTGELPTITEEEARAGLAEMEALATEIRSSLDPDHLGLQASIDFSPTSDDSPGILAMTNIASDEIITGVPDTEKSDHAIAAVVQDRLTATETNQTLSASLLTPNDEKEGGFEASRTAWIEILCTFGPILLALLLFIASVRSVTPSQQSTSPTSTIQPAISK